MSSSSEAGPGPNCSRHRKSPGKLIARSVVIAGGLLTVVWVLAVILLVGWAILAIL
jgi:hypothetical protein